MRGGDLALEQAELLDGFPDIEAQVVDEVRRKLLPANGLRNADDGPGQLEPQRSMLLRFQISGDGKEFLPILLRLLVQLLDFEQSRLELFLAVSGGLVFRQRLGDVEDVIGLHLPLLDSRLDLEQPLQHQRRPGQRLEHRLAAMLHVPGDVDLALARQQGDRSHLAQVHPDGIVGLFGGLGDGLGIGPVVGIAPLFRPFAGFVQDLDAGTVEVREEIVQILAVDQVVRDQLIHLVVGNVAFLFPYVDELL